jgi:hypothetical protein
MKSLKIISAAGILVAMTVLLVRLCNVRSDIVGSDIELIASPKGSYYGDLPILVDYTVNNRGSKDAYVWSVGFGSGAIVPGWILGSDGKPVPHPDYIDGMQNQRIVRLPAGGRLFGRICVSAWATPENGVTGEEFLPGDYSVLLRYKFGTNRNDVVSSTNVIIHIVEPDGALKETRELFRRVHNELKGANTYVFPEELKGNANDCYTTAALSLYANWLQSKKRHDEAIEVWQKILDSGGIGNKVGIKTRMSYSYAALKRHEDARRILEEIKGESDEAFLTLRILDKKKGTPPVDEE